MSDSESGAVQLTHARSLLSWLLVAKDDVVELRWQLARRLRALRRAFDALPDRAQHVVSVARLDMCIFVESEYDLYAEAFAEETRRAQEFTESLDLGRTPTQPWQTGRSR